MKKLFCFFIASLLFISFSRAQVNPPSVKIGSQTWMIKNLDVDHYRNGDPIPQVTDATAWAGLTTGAWCYYNNDSTQGNKYGKLYNWYTVNDPRGLAPQGWHIPSDAEWTTLETTLGGSSVTGGKMKEEGTVNWKAPNTGGNNNNGWSGLPGGFRGNGGSFSFVSYDGYWWSSTEEWSFMENSAPGAWGRTLTYKSGTIVRNDYTKLNGFSVRCIKD